MPYCELLVGKLSLASHLTVPDFNALLTEPDSEEAQRAAGFSRCTVSQVFGWYEKEIGREWSKYFWNRGLELEEPILGFYSPEPHADATQNPVRRFARDYRHTCILALEESWALMPKDLLANETIEVVGALLARQCHLAIKVGENLDLWEWNFGPLLLRTMTDGYITLAWILESPLERSREFINYGLGQEKLQIEHRKAILDEMKDESERKRMQQVIAAQEAWLNSQHFSFLQDVNVGSWSGLSTRKMAIESDCKDLYDFAYTPYSSCAHNTWNHLGKFCCLQSSNPLHKFVRQPFLFEMGVEPSIFMNSAKYYQNSLTAVGRKYEFEFKADLPHDWAEERIDGFLDRLAQEFEGRDEHIATPEGESEGSTSPPVN